MFEERSSGVSSPSFGEIKEGPSTFSRKRLDQNEVHRILLFKVLKFPHLLYQNLGF